MMNDDVYPNDTSYFGIPVEPREQRLARSEEKAKTLEAVTEIEKVIQHFQDRIDFRDSLSSIDVDILVDPALHQKIFQVHRLLKEALEEEKNLLEELLEIHNKNR